ncbi:MAG: PA14 domain-containing protein [Bacteroidota bacterium]
MKTIKFFVLVNFLFLGLSCSAPVTEEEFQVKPYLQFGTQTSMVVMWETREPATTKVEYGESVFDSGEPVLNQTKEIDGYKTMHEVVLDGLKTEKNYFYRVRSEYENGTVVQSEIFPFKTAVEDSTAYMFALVGDSQKNSRTPRAWERIAQLVWEDRPNFVVHVGDIVDDGNILTDWTEHFFPGGHILMSKTSMYTALGNHENDSDYYYQYFHNPPPEYYYTFMYGNAQFFIVDTNRDVTPGSEQYTWLEWELAKSEATWKFVLHHHPPYSSEENDHGDGWKEESRHGTHARNLVPLYEQYGVDFNLFGHTHVYERTWPLKEDLVNMKEGVVYINSGGAGGGLEGFLPTRTWFSAELQTGHHYCTFSIFDRTLVFKAIDVDGRMFDTFQMQKPEGENKASVVQPPAPKIFPLGGIFEGQQEITMEAVFDNLSIRYTTDGSEPNSTSPLYSGAITIDQSSTIRARTFSNDGKASRINATKFRKVEPLEPVSVSTVRNGINYAYFTHQGFEQLPDFEGLTPDKSGSNPTISIEGLRDRDDYFAFQFEGYIQIDEPGRYTFYTKSDDGSKLFIHGQEIVDNDGTHGMKEREGEVILMQGLHPIRVVHFENGGGQGLEVSYKGPGFGQKGIPESVLKSGS